MPPSAESTKARSGIRAPVTLTVYQEGVAEIFKSGRPCVHGIQSTGLTARLEVRDWKCAIDIARLKGGSKGSWRRALNRSEIERQFRVPRIA